MARRLEAGLTLIELVVAMTVLAAIAALATGALRTGLLGAEAVEADAERDNRLRLTQALIRRHLGAARPVRWLRDRRYVAAFEGARDAVDFLAVMPAWPGAAGLYQVRLALEDGRLVMTRRITAGERQGFDFHRPTDSVVLADGVTGLRFSYFGPDRARRPPKWHHRWVDRDALPRLVRLEGSGAGGRWPGLVVALMIDPQPR
ncbi:MAG: prepilin-type N-terminal cleavage/methylation domain-containing protein [Kiloniellales bacterium]